MKLPERLLSALRLAGLSAACTMPHSVYAVEGGLSAYFLGSRDTFAGIVPGAGYYTSIDTIYMDSSVEGVSLGGQAIAAETDLTLKLVKLNQTYVFDSELWGGSPAINVSIPILDADIDFTGITAPIDGRSISDNTSGVGDITVTGIVGWHDGKWHYSTGFGVYAPVGEYSTAKVNPADGTFDVVSNGKGFWSFQPFVAATYFDQESGTEYSGATSLLFSENNSETNHQTAAALIFEGAAMMHTSSGFAYGVAGYYYQQLEDDSGSGADSLRSSIGESSLKARVTGLGPIFTYSKGTVFGKKASWEVKYVKEFEGKRRFEGDILSATMALVF